MKTVLAAVNTSIVIKQQSPPDISCNVWICQHGNTTISSGNIPCDSKTFLQSVLKALIHLQTREYAHYAAPPLQSPQRNRMNSYLADSETRLWTWRGVEGGGCTLHHGDNQHTDGPHTWQCNESAAPPQVSLRAKHISSWFSRLTGKTPLPSTPRTNLDAACNKQRKILRNAGCPNWKKRKGMGLAACMILWLCRSEYSGKLSPLLIHGKLITALIL